VIEVEGWKVGQVGQGLAITREHVTDWIRDMSFNSAVGEIVQVVYFVQLVDIHTSLIARTQSASPAFPSPQPPPPDSHQAEPATSS
jgi:hypothetical protein